MRKQIQVIYGDRPREMVRELLESVRPEQEIPDKNALIGLKPNLVVASRAELGATTHPELVAGVIEYFQERGYRNLLILEGSWVGEGTGRAFRECGYADLSKRYGVPLFDTKKDQPVLREADGIRMEICRKALELDYLINLPVLKGHCQTQVTGALKNLKGCITDREKRHFHTLGLHRPIASLNRVLHTSLVIVDGICGDLDFEEGGNPVRMNRIFCCADPVLADSYIASCMGYQPKEIEYIRLAEQYGVGSADLDSAEIVELNQDKTPARKPSERKVARLAAYAVPKDACSACYANLIQALARLDEEGILKRGGPPICIGQGYRNIRGNRIGIGQCAGGCDRFVGGCPPHTPEILKFLKEFML